MTSKEIKSDKLALSDLDLENWCKENNFSFNVITLDKLSTLKKKASFIHTGRGKNAANGGNENHWMFIYSDIVFDSYGKYSTYVWPKAGENFVFVETHPKQLQDFESTVCGEYCCLFYYYMEKVYEEGINSEYIGADFSEHFGFTRDRKENDKFVFDWFHNDKKQTIDEKTETN